MMTSSAPSQALISKFLNYGDCHRFASVWGNYITDLNLSDEHIPDLINIAVDKHLNQLPIEQPESWAPIHARRALGQLSATAAIEPLMELFDNLVENDWVSEELPKIYGMIGEAAISPLQNYLANTSHQLFPRLGVVNSLEEIGLQNPDSKNQVISVLTQQLQQYAENSPQLNSFIILSLVSLKATQSAVAIKHCFDHNLIADDIVGDWESICTELKISGDILQQGSDDRDTFFQDAPEAEQQNQDLSSIDNMPLGVSNGEESPVTTLQEETEITIKPESKQEDRKSLVEAKLEQETFTPELIQTPSEAKLEQETSTPELIQTSSEVKVEQETSTPELIQTSSEVKVEQETSTPELIQTPSEPKVEQETPELIQTPSESEVTIKPEEQLSSQTETTPNPKTSPSIEENVTVSQIESILTHKSTPKATNKATKGFAAKNNQRKTPKKKKK